MNARHTPADPASKERLRLWLRLLKLSRNVDLGVREGLRGEFGTTLPRFDMLAALSRHPEGLKMSRLSQVLRVSNGNVTGLAQRLADEGMVERVPVPDDRRAIVVRLTPKGVTEFERQAGAHERWINDLLGTFTAEEAREMAAAIADKTDLKENPHAQ